MLKHSSSNIYLIVALLFSISSMPVLGQNSNEELISDVIGFISGDSLDPTLITPILGDAYWNIRAENYYSDALDYYNSGKYELALRFINKSIEAWENAKFAGELSTISPTLLPLLGPSDSWNLKGLILDELGRYEEAINCFNIALDNDPNNAYAWANMGITHYHLGNYNKSIECYDYAIDIDPSCIYAYTQKNLALSAIQSSSTSEKGNYDGTDISIPVYYTPEYSFVSEGGAGYGGSAIVMSEYSSGCIAGSGNIISENRSVNRFDSIDLRLSGNLYLTQDIHQPLRIEGDDNVLQFLVTDVADKTLIVHSDKCFRPTKDINIYVSAEKIGKLKSSGSGKIISQSQITVDTLRVEIAGTGSSDLTLNVGKLDTAVSGSGDISLNGEAKVHNSEISGSGNVKAFDLTTEKTDITVSGSGNAQVNALENLEVNILGSGLVYYKGDATVCQNISGSGRLIKS